MRSGHDVHAAGDEIQQRRSGAIAWHPHHRGSGNLLIVEQPGKRDVPDAALCGPGRLELPRIGPDRVQQIAEGPIGRVGPHLNRAGIVVDEAERGERGAREIGQPLVVHHRDLHRDDADGVAVRRRPGDGLVPHDAAAAGAIDDVDRLPEVFFHERRDHARDGVGSPTRRPGHDHRQRPGRVLGLSAARGGQHEEREQGAHDGERGSFHGG
jgi:hypothetical protein